MCDDFLEKNGIQHQLSTRYTPQQNKVAKRKNKKILDMNDEVYVEVEKYAKIFLNRGSFLCNLFIK